MHLCGEGLKPMAINTDKLILAQFKEEFSFLSKGKRIYLRSNVSHSKLSNRYE